MLCRTIIFATILTGSGAIASAQATTAPATSTVVAAPVERATADAVARLYATIAAERVSGMPLGEVLERAGGRPRVMDALAQAQQIGGPRSIGDGIVQVSLEVRGDRAARIVSDALGGEAATSSITKKQLSDALRPWSERSFRSTGDSANGDPTDAATTATRVDALQQPDAPLWAHDAQTASAVAKDAGYQLRTARQAEKAARDALRDQLAKLQLDSGQTLGQTSRQTVETAAAGAKIAGVDYRADGSVQVSVSIDGQQIWQTLQLTTKHN